MTHLGKDGFGPPFKGRTVCGRVVPTTEIVGKSPDCETCHHAYLAQLEAEREEAEAFYGLDCDDAAAAEGVAA